MKDKALKMLFLSVKDRLNCSFDEFVAAMQGWEIIPLLQADEVIGAVMKQENEIHVGYGVKPTGSILKHIKKTLLEIIQQYGFAVTKVTSDNAKGLSFCKRLGFVETSQQENIVYMKCERCSYAS
jgi:hypothetical protein